MKVTVTILSFLITFGASSQAAADSLCRGLFELRYDRQQYIGSLVDFARQVKVSESVISSSLSQLGELRNPFRLYKLILGNFRYDHPFYQSHLSYSKMHLTYTSEQLMVDRKLLQEFKTLMEDFIESEISLPEKSLNANQLRKLIKELASIEGFTRRPDSAISSSLSQLMKQIREASGGDLMWQTAELPRSLDELVDIVTRGSQNAGKPPIGEW